jgi:glyceraldehyde 3-phosphate dehydrogenase
MHVARPRSELNLAKKQIQIRERMSCVIGINGFGRQGRRLLRAALSDADFKVAAINDPFLDAEQIAHFIRFDSSAGRFTGRVDVKSKQCIAVEGSPILIYGIADPLQIPWSDAGVTVVLEASGVFSTSERAAAHLNGGAQRVVVCGSSPDLPVVVSGATSATSATGGSGAASAAASSNSPPTSPARGSTHPAGSPTSHQIFCTGAPILTALAPFLRVLEQAICPSFSASFVSVQPPVSSQKCGDAGGSRDLRLSRGQVGNLIAQPAASTSLVKVLPKLFPRLGGRIGGTFVYTAQAGASLLDVTVAFDKPAVKVEEVVAAVRDFAAGSAAGIKIAGIETDACVSSDFVGATKSFIVDAGACAQLGPNVVKIVMWYDADASCARRALDAIKM